jgi:hypothetical protein
MEPLRLLLPWCHHGDGTRGLVVLAAAPWWCFGMYRVSPGGSVAVVAVVYHEHERVLGVVPSGESLHHCWWT